MWNEIPDAWDKAVSEQLAIELWGQEYEKLILLNRTSDIENFKNKYLKIQSQINDNEMNSLSHMKKKLTTIINLKISGLLFLMNIVTVWTTCTQKCYLVRVGNPMSSMVVCQH